MIDQIRKLIETGKATEALVALESFFEMGPESTSPNPMGNSFRGLERPGWRECLELAEALLDEITARGTKAELSRVHGIVGYLSLRLGAVHAAETHLRAAIHILNWDLHDVAGAVRQSRRLSLVLKNLGLFHQARFECERAIATADAHGLIRESQANRQNLVVVLIKMGKLREVPSLFEQLDRLLDLPADPRSFLRFQLVRANYLRITGDQAAATEILAEALHTARESHYSREEAIALEYLGDCQLGQRRYPEALEKFRSAMRIAEEVAPGGDIIPELCHRIGEALISLGDPNAAILSCERGLQAARASGDRYEECATHRPLAMAYRAAGNPRKALRVADEGAELSRQYEIPFELGRLLVWSGELRIQDSVEEDQARGRQSLWEARTLFERMGLSEWVRALDRLLGVEQYSVEDHAHREAALVVQGAESLDRNALHVGIITANPEISEAVRTLQSVGPSLIPVLITGESGVGKELLAQALHKLSDRRKGPFVPVNCGALSVSLLDSELFGHERGAFTGAIASREGLLVSANKGTLFLDEVGDLPLPIQAALLRVLETGELRAVGRDEPRKVDVRIVAATNARLEALVERGLFRQDLFYRLNGVRVNIPPLREREEDIRILFNYFWSQTASAAKKQLSLEDGVEAFLCAYNWPGNVRELRYEVARVVAIAPNKTRVGHESFLPHVLRRDPSTLRRQREKLEVTIDERDQIIRALRAHKGNKAEAARSLGGMKRTTLIYRMERLGIRPEEYMTKE